MMVDSKIESIAIDEANNEKIVVFGKLPRVNIPTAHGRSYNPDFGYVIKSQDEDEIYLVVETKGYDSSSGIGLVEKIQIGSARAFFEKLRKSGVNSEYRTKLNKPELSQLISDVLKNRV